MHLVTTLTVETDYTAYDKGAIAGNSKIVHTFGLDYCVSPVISEARRNAPLTVGAAKSRM